MDGPYDKLQQRPPQHQERQPGKRGAMRPAPLSIRPDYRGSGKLKGKVGLITGGDSGVGRSVALHFAREGADVALVYLDEDGDAEATRTLVEAEGRRCHLVRGDVADEDLCGQAVRETTETLGRLDVLVNNAAEQHPQDLLRALEASQLERTFRTNVFSFFYLSRAALPHLGPGASIINTASVTAYRGSAHLVDYAASKGAVVAFTRSLAANLVSRGIRVNAVAPGPIWTPLIPASFSAEEVAQFGTDTPMGRAGQPAEVGPCYVFLASADASFCTGQVLHPNGGGYMST